MRDRRPRRTMTVPRKWYPYADAWRRHGTSARASADEGEASHTYPLQGPLLPWVKEVRREKRFDPPPGWSGTETSGALKLQKRRHTQQGVPRIHQWRSSLW